MLRVILVNYCQRSSDELCTILSEHGHEVVEILQSSSTLVERVSAVEPDVILARMPPSPDRDVVEDIRSLLVEYPCPVAIYDGIKDSAIIARVIDAGVSAYVTDDIRSRDLTSLLQLTKWGLKNSDFGPGVVTSSRI